MINYNPSHARRQKLGELEVIGAHVDRPKIKFLGRLFLQGCCSCPPPSNF